jgi:IclR family mhp operon transcriptional activator
LKEPSEPKYKHIQSLKRGLSIIECLNRLEGGASIAELADLTGIHRTTVHRFVATLVSEGYLRRSESDDSYWLERKVRDLSEGYRDEHWVSSLAAPLLSDLLYEVTWPTDLSTLDVDAMIIRETTHRFSRLSFHRSMVGRRLPLLFSAAGRAYLAFCPASQREELISLLLSRVPQTSSRPKLKRAIQRIVTKTRSKGYGANDGEWKQESRFAAIAVPIIHQGQIYGCLGLVYIAKAMSTDEAAERYLGALRDVVEKIEGGLETNYRADFSGRLVPVSAE